MNLNPTKMACNKQHKDDIMLSALSNTEVIMLCAAIVETELCRERQMITSSSQTQQKYSPGTTHMCRDIDASHMRKFTFCDSFCCIYYVQNLPLETKIFHSKFQKCFRMSYETHLKILPKIKQHKLFSTCDRSKTIWRGLPQALIELLVLGSLMYLGRGWAFDDLEERTGISGETCQKFLHLFLVWGSFFSAETVIAHNDKKNIESSVHYNLADVPGCVGSGDATHVGLLNFTTNGQNPKLNMPSRTYHIFVNCRRRILSTISGHPGRWNDKSLILYDTFATDMK